MNNETLEPSSDPRIALFNPGFRPFFLLAGLTASLLLSLWIYACAGGHIPFGYYSAVVWHGHEMIFGYTVAVIAGFLLTAVRNWTGIPTPGRKALAGLVMLWLAGRMVPFLAGALPHGMIAVWVAVAGVLWTVAFTLFVISYARVLIQPLVDGRPG
ncbi:MAG: NnrS family protein [Gammaproteobacteria bacterium]